MVLSVQTDNSWLNTKSSRTLFMFWGKWEAGGMDHFRKGKKPVPKAFVHMLLCFVYILLLYSALVMLYCHSEVHHRLIRNKT